jgi:hypothetical protein
MVNESNFDYGYRNLNYRNYIKHQNLNNALDIRNNHRNVNEFDFPCSFSVFYMFLSLLTLIMNHL